ncbi:hypothetical protein ACHQM5_014531 [Ranunculus cassubicifolius]
MVRKLKSEWKKTTRTAEQLGLTLESTKEFREFQSIKCAIAGKTAYMRFSCNVRCNRDEYSI